MAVRPSVLLPQGAVALVFPCSWTQSYCSLESWQLPEKAEQALWPLSEGLRCFTSRSAADSPREVIFFFINDCVLLSTARGETTNSTLSCGERDGSYEAIQVFSFCRLLNIERVSDQAFLPLMVLKV